MRPYILKSIGFIDTLGEKERSLQPHNHTNERSHFRNDILRTPGNVARVGLSQMKIKFEWMFKTCDDHSLI